MHDRRLRVVIAGGGTGGHLYPGHRDRARAAGAAAGCDGDVRRARRAASRRGWCRAKGFQLDLLRSAGLKGRSPLAALARPRAAAAQLRGRVAASSRAARRDLVIGVGGYSSGPVVMLAALRGIPTLLAEQNAVPGLTNRMLSRVVSAAAVTFDSTVSFFGRRGFVAGNPVRPEFFHGASA